MFRAHLSLGKCEAVLIWLSKSDQSRARKAQAQRWWSLFDDRCNEPSPEGRFWKWICHGQNFMHGVDRQALKSGNASQPWEFELRVNKKLNLSITWTSVKTSNQIVAAKLHKFDRSRTFVLGKSRNTSKLVTWSHEMPANLESSISESIKN